QQSRKRPHRQKNQASQGNFNKSSPPLVFVVDDAPSVLDHMRDIMEPEFRVAAALSGEEALARLQRDRPDVVLLDVILPGIDGYAVCRQIRKNPDLAGVRIIMISNRNLLDQRLTGYEAGADDYMVKPFQPPELLAKVRVFTRLKAAEDDLREFNALLEERVRLRTRQLVNAEKMAAVGRYAAGIVHNLKTPLQGIMGYTELLAMQHPDSGHISQLRKAAEEMKRIVGAILKVGRQENETAQTDLGLNEVLRDQLELLRASPHFKGVETVLELNPLPPFRGVYHHISQSFANLLRNAAESMHGRERRRLTVSTAATESAILVRVADTGRGIPAADLERIFDSFYTTKPLTAEDDEPTGTGLGLASTREIIASYGGEIRVQSRPGQGTTFTVRLPK
ncbi:MAG: sensor histidine kinase, partial [Thermodesulfobacteriota bacterium]